MQKLLVLFSICFCLLLPAEAEARRCRSAVRDPAPAALQASRLKQKQQNRAAYKYKLNRFKDLSELQKFIAMTGDMRLVSVTKTKAYFLSKSIGTLDPGNSQFYLYARVWVKDFLDKELAAAHLKTGDRFEVASMVRTEFYQKKLRGHKKNRVGAIAGSKWWQKSSHLTGATVDISYDGMSRAGKKWLRKRLINLQKQGKVIAIEEVCQRHFHIMVLPTYK